MCSINGFITSIITQTKHRDSMGAVVDEMYPVVVSDSDVLETYTTKAGAFIKYNLQIAKSGNIAHVTGSIQNISGIYKGSQNVFTWDATPFKPTAATFALLFYAENSTDRIRISLNETGLDIIGLMTPATFNFDFKTYITQD